MIFPSTFQFVIFGVGFEVLTVVRIQNVVWITTAYGLVHTWFWMFWSSFFLGMSTWAVRLEAVGPGQIVCADHLYYTAQ